MRKRRGLPGNLRRVRISGFQGLIREPWPSSVPVGELLSKIGQPDGVIVKMRPDRAIKIKGDVHLKEEFLFGARRSWPLLVKSLWGRSRLRRQWQASLFARERGIPTPEPLAYLEQRRSLVLSRSLLATRYESSFVTLTQYLKRKIREGWSRRRGSAFLKSLGFAVRRMHELGMAHSDLKGSNILVREEGEGWSFRFTDLKAACFFDPERDRSRRRMRKEERDVIRLLSGLRPFFDRSERAFFLISYLPAGGEEPGPIIARWEAESLRKFPTPPGQKRERG